MTQRRMNGSDAVRYVSEVEVLGPISAHPMMMIVEYGVGCRSSEYFSGFVT